MKDIIYPILIGSVVGFMGGFQGIAGGFYISALLLATGLASSQRTAAGTTLLAIIFPLSIGAVYEYYVSGDINIQHGLLIAFTYMVFAYFGAKANKFVEQKYVTLSLAVVLFLTGIYFINMYVKM